MRWRCLLAGSNTARPPQCRRFFSVSMLVLVTNQAFEVKILKVLRSFFCAASTIPTDVFHQHLHTSPSDWLPSFDDEWFRKICHHPLRLFFKPEYLNDVKRILGMLVTKMTKQSSKTRPEPPPVQRSKRLANGEAKLPYIWSDPPATVSDCDGMPADADEKPGQSASNWQSCLENYFFAFCHVIFRIWFSIHLPLIVNFSVDIH